MNKPKVFFRIENQDTMHGMWYDQNGKFEPFIERLTEGKSAKLPMDFNPKHRTGGLEWYSGGRSVEEMHHWFSDRDALELFQNGYKLYRFEGTQIMEEEHEVLFTREGIVMQNEIPLDHVWNIRDLV
jgi:hypothetical protein